MKVYKNILHRLYQYELKRWEENEKHLFQYVLKYYLKSDLEWMKDDKSHQRDIIS